MVLRRHHRDHHRCFGLPKELCHRADLFQRLGQARHRNRGRAVPEALQRAEISAFELRMIQQHVDDGWRKECVRDPVACDQIEEFAGVWMMHDHHPASERHDRKTQHTGGVRQRRERKIGRAPLERIAHQGQRSHRFDVASREHYAFGFAGRSAGAGYERKIINGIAVKGLAVDTGKPTFERRRERYFGVETYELAQFWKIRP